jgi:hypothetical protein
VDFGFVACVRNTPKDTAQEKPLCKLHLVKFPGQRRGSSLWTIFLRLAVTPEDRWGEYYQVRSPDIYTGTIFVTARNSDVNSIME